VKGKLATPSPNASGAPTCLLEFDEAITPPSTVSSSAG